MSQCRPTGHRILRSEHYKRKVIRKAITVKQNKQTGVVHGKLYLPVIGYWSRAIIFSNECKVEVGLINKSICGYVLLLFELAGGHCVAVHDVGSGRRACSDGER